MISLIKEKNHNFNAEVISSKNKNRDNKKMLKNMTKENG